MPLEIKTFRTRALTALIFVIVMMTGLFLNGWAFIVLMLVIHFGCWVEFIRLIQKIFTSKSSAYLLCGLLYISLPIILVITCAFQPQQPMGDITPVKFFSNYSPLLPCAIIFSIWINDTMAYIVGSFLGKTPLSPISPKKTWEGTIGGAVLCITVMTVVGYFTHYLSLLTWIVISTLSAIFGTLGDLLESKLKRLANVKDSGSFMPGHGGFLDRFDSFLIASIPVSLFYLMILS